MPVKRRADKLALGATLLVTAALYGSNLDHSFQYDDAWKIVDNPQLRDPGSYVQALIEGRGYREAATRLLPNLSFALNYRLGGLEPFGYNLVNLGLHLINVVLVWGLAGALIRRVGAARVGVPEVAAAAFALHPLNSEAVSYCNARPNLMVTTFYLSALLCMLAALGTKRAATRWLATAGFGITTTCALLCKEMAVTLVVMAPLLCEWLAPHDRRIGNAIPLVRRLALALGTVGGVTIAVTGALDGIKRVVLVAGPTHTGGVASYLAWTWLGQAPVLLHYTALALWPAPSCLNACRSNHHLYTRAFADGHLRDGSASLLVVPLASAAILALAAFLVVKHRRRHALETLCGAWLFVTHAPHTLLPRGEVMVEYRTYLPMVGACLLLALGLHRAVRWAIQHAPRPAVACRAARMGAAALLVSLVGATHQRLAVWKDEHSFWQDVLAKEPDSPRGHNSVGDLARRAGDLETARQHYQRALESDPNYEAALSNLGSLYATVRRYAQARPLLERALAVDPTAAFAHSNLANVLIELGDLEAAIGHYRLAIAHAPKFVEARMNLARGYLLQGRPADAISSYRDAIVIDDRFAPAHRELGKALLTQGQVQQATAALRRAVALAPADAEAHYQLARALLSGDDRADALAELKRALTVDPSHQRAIGMLAVLSQYR